MQNAFRSLSSNALSPRIRYRVAVTPLTRQQCRHISRNSGIAKGLRKERPPPGRREDGELNRRGRRAAEFNKPIRTKGPPGRKAATVPTPRQISKDVRARNTSSFETGVTAFAAKKGWRNDGDASGDSGRPARFDSDGERPPFQRSGDRRSSDDRGYRYREPMKENERFAYNDRHKFPKPDGGDGDAGAQRPPFRQPRDSTSSDRPERPRRPFDTDRNAGADSGEPRTSFRERRPAFGERRERPERQDFEQSRKPFGGDDITRASADARRPAFGAERPSFGDGRRSFGEGRPSFEDRRGPRGQGASERPRRPFGDDRFHAKEDSGERRPTFRERKEFGQRSFQERKEFGQGRDPFENGGFDRSRRRFFDDDQSPLARHQGENSKFSGPRRTESFNARDTVINERRDASARNHFEHKDYHDEGPSRYARAPRRDFDSSADAEADIDTPGYTTAASNFIYGMRSVLAALKAQKRQFYNLYLRTNTPWDSIEEGRAILALAETHKLKIKYLANHALGALAAKTARQGGETLSPLHDGVCLEASPFPQLPITALGPVDADDKSYAITLDAQSAEDAAVNGTPTSLSFAHQGRTRKNPLLLWLHGTVDMRNVGAIMRTCLYFGADVILSRRGTPSAGFIRTSAGASEFLQLLRAGDENFFIQQSRLQGWMFYSAVAPTLTPGRRDAPSKVMGLDDLPASPLDDGPSVVVLGNEDLGLPPAFVKQTDVGLSIAGRTKKSEEAGVGSLNVGIAAALLVERFVRASTAAEKAAQAQRKAEKLF